MKTVRKAIFPVAGLGTRFLPATKSMPKEMLPVVDKPLIQYAAEEAKDAGIEELIFVTGRAKSSIEDYFDHSIELELELAERNKRDGLEDLKSTLWKPGHISYTRQQKPLGLGHAIWCARNFIDDDEPFAVILADDLIQPDFIRGGCLKQMLVAFEALGRTSNIIATEEVPYEHTHRYGILDPIKEEGSLIKSVGMVEKPHPSKAPSGYAVIGRYILQSSVLQVLEHQEKGAGGEIQLTDAIAKTIGVHDLYGFLFSGTRFDCGNKAGWLEANIMMALARDDMKDKVKKIIKHASKI